MKQLNTRLTQLHTKYQKENTAEMQKVLKAAAGSLYAIGLNCQKHKQII